MEKEEKVKKVSIVLEDLRNNRFRDANGKEDFKVKSLQNMIDFKVGDVISSADVRKLLDVEGMTVKIVENKG